MIASHVICLHTKFRALMGLLDHIPIYEVVVKIIKNFLLSSIWAKYNISALKITMLSIPEVKMA